MSPNIFFLNILWTWCDKIGDRPEWVRSFLNTWLGGKYLPSSRFHRKGKSNEKETKTTNVFIGYIDGSLLSSWIEESSMGFQLS